MIGHQFAWVAFSIALAGCNQRSMPKPASAFLGPDVARVGGSAVSRLLVARVAGAQDVAPRQALDRLVEDALAAEGAGARKLQRLPAVEWATDAALARALSRRLQDEARAEGPPRTDELDQLRVVHAVIVRSPSLPEVRAMAMAESLRNAVLVARDENDFQQRAKAAVHVPVTVERLPQFDATGQMEHGGELDPVFVTAAFGLHRTGETSPVVETRFGWHVLRLLARAAPEPGSPDPRGEALAEAAVELRARRAVDSVLGVRKRRLSIDVAPTAEQLMAQAVAGLR